MVPESDTRVDELRRQLKSLGYLDAGVDRFVLGAARDTRGPVGVAIRASVRVGVLGGALLGPAAAIGLGARLPGLVSGVRDASVLALYLAVFFAVAVAIVSSVVSLAAAAFARTRDDRFAARARHASRAAAWIFTIGVLLYLTLWWRNANAGFGWSAPLWTSFALLVAVAISLLLGHAVRIATLAVLASRSAGAGLPPVSARSWRLVVAGGALALAGASALLLITVSDTDPEAAAPPLTVVDSEPVRLIALDGFDPATFARLESSLPNLHAAFSGRQFPLQSQDTDDPARAWTTIATGVPPDVHGVHAIETRRVAGLRGVIARDSRVGRVIGPASDLLRLTQPSIVSSEQRHARTIWEVAERAGLRTTVVNWWATWPAPADAGIMVTDRGVLRLEHGGPLDAEIAPASVYRLLSAQWPEIRARAGAMAAAAFPDGDDPQTAVILRRSAELDATIAGIAVAIERSPGDGTSQRVDLLAVYFPGLDIAQTALLGPSAGTLATSAMAARVDALRAYYPFLDGVLRPLIAWREYHRTMIVTQPGRVQTSAGGLFVLSRGAPEPGAASRSPLDVAPTVWAALGVPLSRELAGHPIPAATPSTYRYVDTYGRPSMGTSPRTGKPLDQETIDRLRSLGYIK